MNANFRNKKKNSKKIALLLSFILLILVGGFFFLKQRERVHTARQMEKTQQEVSRMKVVSDPEFFLRNFNPAKHQKASLTYTPDPGQLVTYYYHFVSPLYPHTWLKEEDHIVYSREFESQLPYGYRDASLLFDREWNVFWVGTGTSPGELNRYYGPFRSVVERKRESLPVTLTYQEFPGRHEKFDNVVNVVNGQISITSQGYRGGTYTYNTTAYLKDKYIVVHRAEESNSDADNIIGDFRTYRIEETIPIHHLKKGTYYLLIEDTLSSEGYAFINPVQEITI